VVFIFLTIEYSGAHIHTFLVLSFQAVVSKFQFSILLLIYGNAINIVRALRQGLAVASVSQAPKDNLCRVATVCGSRPVSAGI
jgi:hypothetical protein